MKRFGCSWLVVMGLAHAAAAQAPGQREPAVQAAAQGEPAAAPFLEKRVPEELATEGVVLSRNNLGLKLEQIGDRWLVSLLDLTTGRVAASTKLDALPPDREAAVATMTHVVAELATQIVGRGERPPVPAAPVAAAPSDHEVAELKFSRQAIRFGTTLMIGHGTMQQIDSGRGWTALQGDLNEVMSAEKFYTTVGRPDLIEIYQHRRALAVGGWIVTGITFAGTLAFMLSSSSSDPDFGRNMVIGGVGVVVTGGAMWFGMYYNANAHPIDAREAKVLADNYNQGLRRQLGLPVASRPTLLRDFKLAPYATGTTGGLAISARF